MTRFLRWALCRLGQHGGYVDGGFCCRFCDFRIPFTAEDYAVIDRLLARELQARR